MCMLLTLSFLDCLYCVSQMSKKYEWFRYFHILNQWNLSILEVRTKSRSWFSFRYFFQVSIFFFSILTSLFHFKIRYCQLLYNWLCQRRIPFPSWHYLSRIAKILDFLYFVFPWIVSTDCAGRYKLVPLQKWE